MTKSNITSTSQNDNPKSKIQNPKFTDFSPAKQVRIRRLLVALRRTISEARQEVER